MSIPSTSKIAADLPALLARLAPLRASGGRLVFTNGCFDLIHPGHVRYLEAARTFGDALLVAVNSDSSIRRLKGPSRPILQTTERLEVIAALEAVDHVIAFSADTPLELILATRPDVLVKGADWAPGAIVGADEVESWGGRLVRCDLVPGLSTSELIRRIRAS